ncbi:MAG: sn-glycerol-1-phosphate dehydrogenase [Firmicutes bacterium]|jgi:glycerol-1-phosphate dehydrogenase [NAD(P)+]|nr:sn-glycerol-1-phosphate dehydrogenase [Bacillota bacterium]
MDTLAAMDVELAALRQGYNCSCGRIHHLPIADIEVAQDVLISIPDRLRNLGFEGPVHLIADSNTLAAAGAVTVDALDQAGLSVSKTIFVTQEDTLVPDELALSKLFMEVPVAAEVLIAVGAGTITDLVRFAAYKMGKPFVSIPTAPSMDGYASAVSPLIVGGFKRTFSACPPLAIYADLDVLCKAPMAMIAAGFGDLVGKYTARADWEISRTINDEYFCQSSLDLMAAALELCTSNPEGLRKREPQLVKALMEGLILSGIAISMAGNSRPASGAEHQLAHYWEMRSLKENRHSHLHGTKVGVAAPLVLGIYSRVLGFDPSTIDLDALAESHQGPEAVEAEVRAHYGPMAEEILAESLGKRLTWEARKDRIRLIQGKWEEIRGGLAWLPTADAIRLMLKRAGAESSVEELGLPDEWVDDALRYARQLRSRYTILDLAAELGI